MRIQGLRSGIRTDWIIRVGLSVLRGSFIQWLYSAALFNECDRFAGCNGGVTSGGDFDVSATGNGKRGNDELGVVLTLTGDLNWHPLSIKRSNQGCLGAVTGDLKRLRIVSSLVVHHSVEVARNGFGSWIEGGVVIAGSVDGGCLEGGGEGGSAEGGCG